MLSRCLRWLTTTAAALACTLSIAADARAVEKRWVVIFVGIPGDATYEQTYQGVADSWVKSFTEDWGIPAEQVLRPKAPLTAAVIESTLADVAKLLQADDSLWLLTLGHGDHDGKQSRFHVAGRDPVGADWQRYLADVKCREQVIWLTHASSGYLVKPLSQPGRVVIAATEAAEELNETEFPHALAKVLQSPAKDLDVNADGEVSLAELFQQVVKETNARFAADKRVPTEHAQLDDNGDGRGSESIPLNETEASTDQLKQDGALARQIVLPRPKK